MRIIRIVFVQSLCHIWLFVTPWTTECRAPAIATISWSLLKFMPIGSVMLSDISSFVTPFSCCLQSFPASGCFPISWLLASGDQRVKSFSFSISPSNEYSVLISFRIDWLDLLAVQGTLKSLLQHHN